MDRRHAYRVVVLGAVALVALAVAPQTLAAEPGVKCQATKPALDRP
jgi:hypothetical protein